MKGPWGPANFQACVTLLPLFCVKCFQEVEENHANKETNCGCKKDSSRLWIANECVGSLKCKMRPLNGHGIKPRQTIYRGYEAWGRGGRKGARSPFKNKSYRLNWNSNLELHINGNELLVAATKTSFLFGSIDCIDPCFYRPPIKLREGNVFSRVCLSTRSPMWPITHDSLLGLSTTSPRPPQHATSLYKDNTPPTSHAQTYSVWSMYGW